MRRLFWGATLITQLAIVYASGIGLFWAILLIIAANLHSLSLLLWVENQ